jgi:hypothetical protein
MQLGILVRLVSEGPAGHSRIPQRVITQSDSISSDRAPSTLSKPVTMK